MKKPKLLYLKKHNFFSVLKKLFFTTQVWKYYMSSVYFSTQKIFLRVKAWSFLLLVWVGNFLQNVREHCSLVTSNRLTNLAQRLLLHSLLLNCIFLVFYVLDQNFLWATSSYMMTARLVGSSPIGISHTGLSRNNWRKLSGLLQIHSMDIQQLTKVQWTVVNAFSRTSANNWRKWYRWREGTPIKTNILFVENRPMTDDHSIYSVRHSTNSIYREIKKNSVNDTLKRFLEKTKEF
jgi:hypothetical protein